MDLGKGLGHLTYSTLVHQTDDWDQQAFDPNYDTLPLEHFEPLVREVFASGQII